MYIIHAQWWRKVLKSEWASKVETILKGSLYLIPSPSPQIQWKFKLWAGKFAWSVKAKYYWALSTNFWKQKVCWHHQQCFASLPQVNFPTNDLNFHWSWRLMGSNPGYLFNVSDARHPRCPELPSFLQKYGWEWHTPSPLTPSLWIMIMFRYVVLSYQQRDWAISLTP